MTIYLVTYDQLFDVLAALKRLDPPYPAGMLAERRAAFVERIGEWNSDPDCVDGESVVSQWEDERNSRPFPF